MRIASLVPSSTEILFAVGAGASVVARSHECDHPQGAVAIPAVTSDRLDASMPSRLRRAAASPVGDAHTIYELDESALAAARPDVIITQSL